MTSNFAIGNTTAVASTNNLPSSGGLADALDPTALNGGTPIPGDGQLIAAGLGRPSRPPNPAAMMKSWSEILKTRVAPGAIKPAGFGKVPVIPAPSQNKNTSVPALFNRSGKTWKVPGVPEFKGQVRGELMVGLDQALTPRRMQVFDGLSEGQQITARTLIGAALDAMSLPAGSAGRIDPKHMGAVVETALKEAQQTPTALDAAAKPQVRTPTTRPVPPAQTTRTPTTKPVPPAPTARTPNPSAATERPSKINLPVDLKGKIEPRFYAAATKGLSPSGVKQMDQMLTDMFDMKAQADSINPTQPDVKAAWTNWSNA